jgi:hypothetical protein
LGAANSCDTSDQELPHFSYEFRQGLKINLPDSQGSSSNDSKEATKQGNNRDDSMISVQSEEA